MMSKPIETMRALVSSHEGPRLTTMERPSPGPGQVLVRVHAAPLNRADLAMLKGASHGQVGGAGAPLGLEWAGEIAAVGEGVVDWKAGDRVMGAGGGAFADYTLGYAAFIYPVPSKLSFVEAATVPVAIQTMHDAIATNGARSEEHTSELQSLMRNSYAVFCLQKKNTNIIHLHNKATT